ncbi:type II toxin-antitoxin system death-on-curing family toxin [Cryobacterium fucosi]|uniref:Type II toxin-antitoxin system death-on-curing family toxin n=1 Tax=Cryobacterium fucosi TaxID=1259157 RepID=A0A4V3IVH0_9MICO|nr:Fic family protein [Cryobacterium fucosi]TFD78258.1 type II toxin-antitoxin system death-on-curing family toxin [Cryobacterium fucosi]
MTEYLEPADVEDLIALAGFHVRGRNLLLSALAAPLPVFGEEVYPGLHDKAAALLIAINNDHPLSDGNKRLAWIVTKGFLALNGHHLAAGSAADGDAFVRSVADHRVERIAIVDWIETHSRRL